MSDKKYTVIAPLGKREGSGTFDCFFDAKKHIDIYSSVTAGDYVQADFVLDEEEIIFVRLFHLKHPDDFVFYRLQWQNFPFGIDAVDDRNIWNEGNKLLEKYYV